MENRVSDLDERGFLSIELETQKQHARKQFQSAFLQCDAWSDQAMALLKQVTLIDKSPPQLLAIGYWMRCVRACQGGILLAERGMVPDALTLARSAVESLFHAVALTKNPDVMARLVEHDNAERVKQARGILANPLVVQHIGDADRARVEALIEARVENPRLFSAHDAAREAGLLALYETMFRGFSLDAAHSTLTALDHEFVKAPDGSISPDFGPSYENVAWALEMLVECLKIGVSELKAALI